MAIKLRTVIKHPASVEAGTGLAITKENGTYTYELDLGSLNEADTIPDDANAYLTVLTPGATADDPDVTELISVETFLNETAAVNQSRQVISGAGLTGGGDLSADRTLAVGAGTGISVSADAVALDTSSSRNVDHSAVSVIAGSGLTGGGTIAADRTLNVGAGTGITVNADDVALAAIADQRVMANVSGGSAAPSANTLTAVLDAILGSTQGAILTRQGSAWVKLDPGTSGYFLKSQGAGANLTYAAVPGGGDMLAANNLSDVSNTTTARQNIHATLKGFLFGLTLSNNGTDATNDIDIAVGEAADSDGAYLMRLTSGITKRLDASWAVGTGNGGLDTGAIADTTYHVYLIQRSDTGVVDALFSTSASSPTMPTNYDRKRRIGSIVRTGGAIKAFTQQGDEFLWMVPVQDISAVGTLGTSATLYALTVPAGLKVQAMLDLSGGKSSAGGQVLVTSPDQTDSAATIFTFFGTASGTSYYGFASGLWRTDTSRQIRARSSLAATEFYGVTRGYIDRRGKDA